jgi:hypothetical protein
MFGSLELAEERRDCLLRDTVGKLKRSYRKER